MRVASLPQKRKTRKQKQHLLLTHYLEILFISLTGLVPIRIIKNRTLYFH